MEYDLTKPQRGWGIPMAPLPGPPPGEPLPITVDVTPLPQNDIEKDVDAAPFLAEVLVGGRPVFGERVVANRYAGHGPAFQQHAREYAAGRFAERLAQIIGYDPEEARR